MENLEQLIEACKAGVRHAQNRLYGEFAPRLYVVCQRYADSKAEADDILQEGFIRIFTHLDQYRHEGSFEGWMRRIVVNSALQRFAARKRMAPVVSLPAEEIPVSEDNTATAVLGQKELMALVQKLPPAYRMVFNLYVFEGMKHREIAEALGISEGTSKSNLSDARTFLQREISKMTTDHTDHRKTGCL